MLDERPTNCITAFLTEPGTVSGNPHRLKANEGRSFIGSYVLGMGYVMEPEEAAQLIVKDARNKDVLFPYLNGEDLNSRPDQSPSRWVINFFDWPLNRETAPMGYAGPVAADYPDCLEIIEKKVKPEREKNNRKVYREKWWQYAEKQLALQAAIAGAKNVLVRARIANMHSVAWVPFGWVYNEKTVVFPGGSFVILQSTIHEVWVRYYSSTLRTDLQYTPTDCCETFPFLESRELASIEMIGEQYHEHRQQIMLTREEGLTKTSNRLHNPDENFPNIQKLRDLHMEMDNAVAAAYGWDDLDLGHSFHATKQGIRFTISEPARREVLARLLKLNHERYAEEVRQGLHDKKKINTSKDRKRKDTTSNTMALALFD
jgi:hypothetical protein